MLNRHECCTNRESIAALVLGELDPAAAEQLHRHLENCASCRSFREALADQEEELRSTFDAVARSVGRVEQLVERFDGPSDEFETVGSCRLRRLIGGSRVMLRSRKMLAAAAAIVVVFTGLASWLIHDRSGQGMVFGQVMDQLRVFRPYSCTYTFRYENRPPLTYRLMRMSLSRRREIRSEGTVYVFDMSERPVRILTLNPIQKTAVEETLVNKGPTEDPDMLRIVAGMSSGTAEDLGVQQVDGRLAHGFHRPDPVNEFTIWADPQTGLPVRIEIIQPELARTVTLNDFDFTTALDESLFATSAPEGYTVTRRESTIQTARVTAADMARRATFKTYVLSKDPAWTHPMQIIEATDPASPGHWMYVAAAVASDSRHVVLAQSQTFNVALPEKIRQAKVVYTSPSGFKVWSGGPEKWYSQVLLNSARDIIGDSVSEARRGFALESPAGTFPLLAINGAISDEELHALVDSLIPAEEYKGQ